MMPWYKNSTLQMDDGEMQWLQSKDAASCAVWEWLKGDCQKRGEPTVRQLSPVDMEMVARMLGIDSPRFSQILHNLKSINWITQENEIRNWAKWQPGRTKAEDAARKRAEYQKKKATQNANKTAVLPENVETTQAVFSQVLPNSPSSPPIREEENREDKNRRDKNKNTALTDAEKIYQLYPRKVGKPDALKAILKALTKHSPEHLIERTTLYAKIRSCEESSFTPYPAKWFNNEMFNDDPATWESKSSAPKKRPESNQIYEKIEVQTL